MKLLYQVNKFTIDFSKYLYYNIFKEIQNNIKGEKTMKKLFALVLSAVMLLPCFVSCGESGEHVHDFSKTPCTEIQKCKCGETNGEKTGNVHQFEDYVCTQCEQTLFDELFRVFMKFAAGKFGIGSYGSSGGEESLGFKYSKTSNSLQYNVALDIVDKNLAPDKTGWENHWMGEEGLFEEWKSETQWQYEWSITVYEGEEWIACASKTVHASEITKDTKFSDYEIEEQRELTEKESKELSEIFNESITKIMDERIIAALEHKENVNNITLAGLGFVNYK